MKRFDNYLEEIKSQLDCNVSEDYKNHNITYLYTNEQVDSNLDYFIDCMKNQLSPYKALLFFNNFLDGDYDGS